MEQFYTDHGGGQIKIHLQCHRRLSSFNVWMWEIIVSKDDDVRRFDRVIYEEN